MHVCRDTERYREIQRDTERYREIQRDTEIQRYRDTEIQRQRESRESDGQRQSTKRETRER